MTTSQSPRHRANFHRTRRLPLLFGVLAMSLFSVHAKGGVDMHSCATVSTRCVKTMVPTLKSETMPSLEVRATIPIKVEVKVTTAKVAKLCPIEPCLWGGKIVVTVTRLRPSVVSHDETMCLQPINNSDNPQNATHTHTQLVCKNVTLDPGDYIITVKKTACESYFSASELPKGYQCLNDSLCIQYKPIVRVAPGWSGTSKLAVHNIDVDESVTVTGGDISNDKIPAGKGGSKLNWPTILVAPPFPFSLVMGAKKSFAAKIVVPPTAKDGEVMHKVVKFYGRSAGGKPVTGTAHLTFVAKKPRCPFRWW